MAAPNYATAYGNCSCRREQIRAVNDRVCCWYNISKSFSDVTFRVRYTVEKLFLGEGGPLCFKYESGKCLRKFL
jgi:hypothetical protein